MVSFNRFMGSPDSVTNTDLENLYRYGSVSFGKKKELTSEQKAIVRGVLLIRWRNGVNVTTINKTRLGEGTCRDYSRKFIGNDSDYIELSAALTAASK